MRLFFVIFCAAWIGGIAAGAAGAPGWALLAASVLAAAAAQRLRLSLPAMVAAGSLVWLGALHGAVAPQVAECSPGEQWTGIVIERPRITEGWQQAVVAGSDGCRVLLTADRWLPLPPGTTVTLWGGEWQTLAAVADFSKGYAGYLERQGITLTWRWADARIVATRQHRLHSVYAAAGERISSVFAEPDASLVRALLLADRSGLPDDLVEQFRVAGVSHVLAISGLHVSLMAGLFYGAALLLPLSAWPRLLLMLALLWGYLLFIGAPVSAVRAGIFWTLAGVAVSGGWLVSLPAVLTSAAVLMLSVRPKLVLEVGWQLSFAAVAGIFLILFLLRPALHRLRERGTAASFVAGLLLVSIGATLATWPLTLYHFGSVSLVSLPANLIIVPVSMLTLTLAGAALLLFGVWQPAGLAAAYITQLLAAAMDGATAWLARAPYASLDEVSLPVWVLALYYLLLVATCMAWLRRQGRRWREVWAP